MVKKFGEDLAGALAATIAYFSLFSRFPLLLALVTVLGFVLSGREELQEQIVDSALAQYPVLGDQIEDNIGALDGDLVTLAVGLGGALWAGLGALQAISFLHHRRSGRGRAARGFGAHLEDRAVPRRITRDSPLGANRAGERGATTRPACPGSARTCPG